jgi:signal transduction histidine kinase
MDELNLLKTIRLIWLNRTVQQLARGASLREDLRRQLENYYALLEQVVETGDQSWLDSILAEWAMSLTVTDLEENTNSLTSFATTLMQQTTEICKEALDEDQALAVINALMPAFSYTIERSAQHEIEAKINYVTTQLNKTRQSLEKLDKSKSDFIAVAAHELKTPLTLVEGYSSMLRESIEQREGPQSDIELVDGISNGARRLRAIVDDMIDVSLIDNRLMMLNIQPIWLDRLFAVLQSELKTVLAERKQHFVVNKFPGADELTFGDPERLLQVFRNILTNAIKFTPDNGHIWIDGRKLPGFVEISITDDGIGIDTNDQAVIFEKFARIGNISLHSSGKTKFKGGGPGLGLHIAKGIVEAHGGAIWVESEGCDEDNYPGSTFHILLPLHAEPPDAKTARLFASLVKPNTPN